MAKRFGVMLDMSRNGVMKPEQVKEYADMIKKLGYNMIQLYTEDTYEVTDEPYFGYLRGRYSKEELKDMVQYCNSIGIELIPCIQTLAHLATIFTWKDYSPICDIGDILLCEEERTYQLIENMFRSIRECFTGDIVHIGMDEAHMLGLGRYLDKHGVTNRFDILRKHLEKVIEIAKKYNFKPIMWSDMFFRLANKGVYFLDDPSVFKDEHAAVCPDGVEQVYWDYYCTWKTRYPLMLEAHKKFKGETWFAGGIWTWNGFAAGNGFSMETMFDAMAACRDKNVDNIFMTMWGDNGKECSFWSVLPSLYAVRRSYDGVTDMDVIKKEFKDITGENFDDMMLLDLQIYNEEGKKIDGSINKYLLYSDAFLGHLDAVVKRSYKEDYLALAEKLEEASKTSAYSFLFDSHAALCRTLATKNDLGVRTRAAYKADDKDALSALVLEFGLTIESLEKFIKAYRALWFHDNKPHGFDIQEIRLGGLLLRLNSQKERLEQYLSGAVANIPELEEEILEYHGPGSEWMMNGMPKNNWWGRSASINNL